MGRKGIFGVGVAAFQFKTLRHSKKELRDTTLGGKIARIIIPLWRNFISLAFKFFLSLIFKYVGKRMSK